MVAALVLCAALLLAASPAHAALLRGGPAVSVSCADAEADLERVHEEDTSAPFMPLDAYLQRARATLTCLAAARRAEEAGGLGTAPEEAGGLSDREMYLVARVVAYLKQRNAMDVAQTWIDGFVTQVPEGARSRYALRVWQWYGLVHYFQGSFAESIRGYTRALTHLPPDGLHGSEAQLCIDLATFLKQVDDRTSARLYLQRAARALEAQRAAQPAPSSMPVARLEPQLYHTWAELLLGEADRTQYPAPDSLAKAIRFAERARRGYRRRGDANNRLRVQVTQAEALHRAGDTTRARALLREAERQARTEAEVSVRTRGYVAYRHGNLHLRDRRLDDAAAAFDRGLRFLGPSGLVHRRSLLLTQRAQVLEAEGAPAQAERVYRRALRDLKRYREGLRLSAWSAGSLSSVAPAYAGLVRTLLAQGRMQEAFVTLETSRARDLTDLRALAQIMGTSGATRQRYDSLSTALAATRTALTEAAAPQARERLKTNALRLATDLRRLVRLDRLSLPHLRLQTLQDTLRQQGRVLLSYFLDGPAAYGLLPGRPHAFLVTPDTLVAAPLDIGPDGVEVLLRAVSPLLLDSAAPVTLNTIHFETEPLHLLYRALLAPVAAHVPDGARLAVVPDGVLHHLPFGLLLTGPPAARFAYAEAPYLLRRHAVAHALAASTLLAPPAPPPDPSAAPPLDLFALGKTQFADAWPLPSLLRAATTDPLPDLPGVDDELRTLRRLFADARAIVDPHATEARYHATARRPRILHVASHALLAPQAPLYNALVLSPSDAPPVRTASAGAASSGTALAQPTTRLGQRDGFLYLHEVRLNETPLVVLSGCHTAAGTLLPGEGLRGLQYAFRARGARSTLSTLWPMEDASAVDLMAGFYEALRDGQPKDVALQRSQLRFLAATTPERASPFFWGAAVLYGETQPLALAASHGTGAPWGRARSWTFGFALLLVGATGLAVALIDRLASSFTSPPAA